MFPENAPRPIPTPSRTAPSGPPQAYGRLWIARTQQASPLDARNTLYRSLYFPRGMPPAPTPLRRNWTFVPNRKYKSELNYSGGLSSVENRQLYMSAALRSFSAFLMASVRSGPG